MLGSRQRMGGGLQVAWHTSSSPTQVIFFFSFGLVGEEYLGAEWTRGGGGQYEIAGLNEG
jgi:hypothetical protein